ncbi:MAG: MBL fold metallo-hydrolase [Nitrososphaerales archaeon]
MKSSKVTEILPGLYQFRLPIPIRSLKSVFAYFAFDGKSNLLIDTGWPSEEAQESLESALSSLGFSLGEIETVIVSHLHPDHFGLAEEIRERAPNSKLVMHKADAEWILNTREEYERFVRELHDWLKVHGTPKQELSAMYSVSIKMLNFFRPPKPTVIANGGEVIKVGQKWRFEIIHTPGHTIGNICLYERGGSKAFFSGDHILPTITPNVSLSPRYNTNPLGDYLSSLESLKTLDAGHVLPSHEYVFSNLKERIQEIQGHHLERLEEVISIVKKQVKAGTSAYNVSKLVHWDSGPWESLSAWEKRAALMETLAHLEYLKRKRRLTETQEGSGTSRKIRYVISKSSR